MMMTLVVRCQVVLALPGEASEHQWQLTIRAGCSRKEDMSGGMFHVAWYLLSLRYSRFVVSLLALCTGISYSIREDYARVGCLDSIT
jgi:hypothetical protein